jgi:hypothetical protein
MTPKNSEHIRGMYQRFKQMMAIFSRRNFYKLLATTLAAVTLVKSVWTLAHGPEKRSFLSDDTYMWSYLKELFWITLSGTPIQVMTITHEVHVLICVVNIIAAVLILFGVIIDKEICLWPGLVFAAVDLGQDVYNAATITPLIRDHVGDTPARVFLLVLDIIMTIEAVLMYACLKLILILKNEKKSHRL